jgi:HD-GYP domain-containing protein (c-di-GMP phosphodiesterase class II)
VLLAVAQGLSTNGAIVGRYGGDEFVAILPGADRAAAERYRDAVLAALADAGLRDPATGAGVPVAVSIGLAVYPTDAAKIEELLERADSEMYAAKRQRPVRRGSLRGAGTLGSDRAAKMVGEIVPLLTSPGDLNDKLGLVAHRLSVGAGYDAVNFRVFGPPIEEPTMQATFAQAPRELVEVWKSEMGQVGDHPLRAAVERTRRPIILDDVQRDQRVSDTQRELVRAAGLRSALIAPMICQNELIGHLSVASKRKAAFGPRDAQFVMTIATQVTAVVRMATLVEELQSASNRLAEARTETVMLLAASAEAHDHTTGLHLQNVRATTEALARELGHSDEDAKELGLAAVLHDIGKVRVPDFVLGSTGELSDEEWELMKHHSTWGEKFLKGRPGFELAATIARSHHEHWDGSGYPDGLSDDDIPETATIVAAADAFDAMISDRPYRAARSVAAALREIAACSGKQFSPKVAQAMARLRKRKLLPRTPGKSPGQKAAA